METSLCRNCPVVGWTSGDPDLGRKGDGQGDKRRPGLETLGIHPCRAASSKADAVGRRASRCFLGSDRRSACSLPYGSSSWLRSRRGSCPDGPLESETPCRCAVSWGGGGGGE